MGGTHISTEVGTSSTPTVVRHIADSLARRILSGEEGFQPGTRLRIMMLSDMFGASPTPIKEALRELHGQGIVVINPRKGAIGRFAVGPRLRRDHGPPGRAGAPGPPSRRIERVSGLDPAGAQDGRPKAGPGPAKEDSADYFDLDLRFHSLIAMASSNEYLASSYQDLTRRAAIRGAYLVESIEAMRESHAEHIDDPRTAQGQLIWRERAGCSRSTPIMPGSEVGSSRLRGTAKGTDQRGDPSPSADEGSSESRISWVVDFEIRAGGGPARDWSSPHSAQFAFEIRVGGALWTRTRSISSRAARRRDLLRIGALLGGAAVASAVLAACGTSSTPAPASAPASAAGGSTAPAPSGAPASAAAGKPGGHLRVAQGADITQLDPFLANITTENGILFNIYETLGYFDDATCSSSPSWPSRGHWADDDKSVTFNLQTGREVPRRDADDRGRRRVLVHPDAGPKTSGQPSPR